MKSTVCLLLLLLLLFLGGWHWGRPLRSVSVSVSISISISISIFAFFSIVIFIICLPCRCRCRCRCCDVINNTRTTTLPIIVVDLVMVTVPSKKAVKNLTKPTAQRAHGRAAVGIWLCTGTITDSDQGAANIFAPSSTAESDKHK